MDASALMVLETRLDEEDEFTTSPRINCSWKKAYGCGEHGQALVDGLSLHVRRLDYYPHLTCGMSISLGQEAIRSVRAELGSSKGLVEAEGDLQIVSQQLLVILAVFKIHGRGKLARHLVYDTTDASLYMIPSILDRAMVYRSTPTPVPRRTTDGWGPQLLLMARKSTFKTVKQEFLCTCTLPTRANPDSDRSVAWQVKKQRFPKIHFSARVMFSFRNKVFWADLSQGLAFCDPEPRDREDSVVEFEFIELPKGYEIGYVDWPEDEAPEPAMMSRNMVCVGGCIKFICIDRTPGFGHEKIRLWTLDFVNREWNQEEPIPWKELRKQVVCPESRDLQPRYPNLLPDGTLCLLLYNMRQIRHTAYDYICSFDMSSKRILSSGRFRHFCTRGPVVLPYDFFSKCCSPLPRQSELPTHKRKRDSIWRQSAVSSAGIAQNKSLRSSPTRTLRVSGFDPACTKAWTIEDHFEKFGTITCIQMNRHDALVQYESLVEAARALSRSQDSVFTVQYSERDVYEQASREIHDSERWDPTQTQSPMKPCNRSPDNDHQRIPYHRSRTPPPRAGRSQDHRSPPARARRSEDRRSPPTRGRRSQGCRSRSPPLESRGHRSLR